jgi:hypothetical protein
LRKFAKEAQQGRKKRYEESNGSTALGKQGFSDNIKAAKKLRFVQWDCLNRQSHIFFAEVHNELFETKGKY